MADDTVGGSDSRHADPVDEMHLERESRSLTDLIDEIERAAFSRALAKRPAARERATGPQALED